MPQTIADVPHAECYGCSACQAICPKKCIHMPSDDEGFLYPVIDDSNCIRCGLCYSACPVNIVNLKSPRGVYAVKAKDSHIQQASSSGGAFMVLAQQAINQGYLVFGAVYDADLSGVHHESISNVADLTRLRGSKYVQSDLRETYAEVKKLLLAGRKVLFSGLGCQIQGLQNSLGKTTYPNLLTIDLLCHGVPSPLLFKDYIRCITRKYGKITSLNMKDKENGWGQQQLRFTFANPTKKPHPQGTQLWNKIFYSNVALRPSCYGCKFAHFERGGDLSLGDFWGIESQHPSFYDKNGVSLLLTNTEKGQHFLDETKEQLTILQTDKETCMQPALSHAVEKPQWRNFFWKQYQLYGFEHVAWHFWHTAFSSPLKIKVRQLFRRK